MQDSHKYWAPKMQPMQSKEIMLLHLRGKKTEGYKRKKLKLSVTPTVNNLEIRQSSDMEVEEVAGGII